MRGLFFGSNLFLSFIPYWVDFQAHGASKEDCGGNPTKQAQHLKHLPLGHVNNVYISYQLML